MGNKCFTENTRKNRDDGQSKDDNINIQTITQNNVEINTQNYVETNTSNNVETNTSNNVETNNQNNDETNDYEPQEVLELKINSLIDDKKNLLQKLEKKNINTQKYRDNINNIRDYGNLKYPEEYKSKIDELLKEVNKLEKIIKNNNIGNQNNANLETQIFFKFASGGECTLNVENETKLGDTFRKTAFYKEGNNINKMIFLYCGKNVSQNFRKNDTVSSINNNSLSTLSIIVTPQN